MFSGSRLLARSVQHTRQRTENHSERLSSKAKRKKKAERNERWSSNKQCNAILTQLTRNCESINKSPAEPIRLGRRSFLTRVSRRWWCRGDSEIHKQQMNGSSRKEKKPEATIKFTGQNNTKNLCKCLNSIICLQIERAQSSYPARADWA